MLRIERSEDFWSGIIRHPSVGNSLGMADEEFLSCVAHPQVTPFASENGGFLTIDLGIGLMSEFHTVFTELGRGREAFSSACELAEILFQNHDVLTTYETANITSRPPRSFGFQTEDSWITTPKGDLKLWYLTKSRWRQSPAHRRNAK